MKETHLRFGLEQVDLKLWKKKWLDPNLINCVVLKMRRIGVSRNPIWNLQMKREKRLRRARALFGLFFFITQFPSLNFCYSLLITHHFKYYTRLAPSLNFHHLIFFTLFVGPIPITHCRLFIEPSEKKKKREETQNRPKKKKKEPNR